MSEVGDLARSFWGHVLNGAHEVEAAVNVVTAVTTGIKQTSAGNSKSVLAWVAANNPTAFKLIKDTADSAATFFGGPLAGFGVEIAFDLLAYDHGMTPEQEKAWMDRQGSGEGGN